MTRGQALLAIALLAGYASSCLGVSDLAVPKRRLAGAYWLTQFESEHYFLDHDGGPAGFTQVLDGEVARIGWNEKYILAWRSSWGAGDSGWMVVDTATGAIRGPFTDEALSQERKIVTALASIEPRPVEEAFRTAPR